MTGHRKLALAALAASLTWLGCPKADQCKGVQCDPGFACDPRDGQCKGGSDSGTVDAGPPCGSCPAATPVCLVASATCVTCTATEGCSALAPVCDTSVSGGHCVQCLADSDCPPLTPTCDLTAKTCLGADAGMAPNDDCASATALTFAGGVATFSGDTTGAHNSNQPNDTSPSCSSSAIAYGPDVVFSFTLAMAQDVVIDVTPAAGSTLQPAVYVRSLANCASGALANELGCAAPVRSGGDAYLGIAHLAAGSYVLWVDSAGGSFGAFTGQVTLSPSTPPPANDDCPGQAINFTAAGGIIHVAGTTFGATNSNLPIDLAPTCGLDNGALKFGADVVYALSIPGPGDLSIIVTPDGGQFQPVVYVRTAGNCTSGDPAAEMACTADNPASMFFRTGGPTSYSIWVDGASRTSGPFDLSVEFDPKPANDDCPGTALAFVGNTATANGTTLGATVSGQSGDTSPSCGFNFFLPIDVVYSYTLAAAHDVQITVTPTASSQLAPIVYVRSPGQCSDGAAIDGGAQIELGCASAFGPASLTLLNQKPGTYSLWVAGQDGSQGPFTVQVTIAAPTPPPPNTTCLTAASLPLPTTGLAGTTLQAGAKYDDWCADEGFLGTSGPEVVYSLTTPDAGDLHVTVTPVKGGPFVLDPFVYLRDPANCTSTTFTGSLGCAVASRAEDPAVLTVAALPAGTYNLIVDSKRASMGPFTLDARLDPLAGHPSNTTCGTAKVLDLSSGTASLEAFTADAGSATRFSCDLTVVDPQLVYALPIPALDAGITGYNLRVSVQGENADQILPLVDVRETCGNPDAGNCQLSGADPFDAIAVQLGLRPSTNYYAWVTSNAVAPQDRGAVTLQVDLAPVPAPNDACASAVALSSNTSVPGSTLGAANDYDRLTHVAWYTAASALDGGADPCDTGMDLSGADVVYAYQAPATGTAVVTVQPQAGYDVAVVLLSACAPDRCLKVVDQRGPGAAESFAFPVTAGTTYRLVVDSPTDTVPPAPQARGGFVIQVAQ